MSKTRNLGSNLAGVLVMALLVYSLASMLQGQAAASTSLSPSLAPSSQHSAVANSAAGNTILAASQTDKSGDPGKPSDAPVAAPINQPEIQPSNPQDAIVITGSIGLTNPVQTGRLFRGGVPSTCGTPNTVSTIAGSYHYSAYTFTNTTGSTACYTVSITTACSGNNNIFAGSYVGAFDPNNILTNLQGDMGSSPNPTGSYGVNVPAGATMEVVVAEVTANAGCPSYTLTVASPAIGGTPTPTITPTPCSGGGIPGPWSVGTVGPPARYRIGGAADGTYAYIYGGQDSTGTASNGLWRWNPADGSWLQLANMPTAKANIQGAYYNGKIYVPGGFTSGSHINEMAIYNIGANTWSTGTVEPAARTGATAAYNGKIYVFGGNPGPSNQTLIYDIAGNSWTTGANMPVGITYGRAVTNGNYMYYMGGIVGVTVATVYRYDPVADSWMTMTPLQTARTSAELMAAPDGSKIYAVNGGDASFFTGIPLSQTVEIYDVAGNIWSYGNPTTQTSAGPAGGLAGGKLIIQGGVSNTNYYNTVQVSTLSPGVCGTATPTATSTAVPPTDTPTATSTSVPPTNTPQPTSTLPLPTVTLPLPTSTVTTTGTPMATTTVTTTGTPMATTTVTTTGTPLPTQTPGGATATPMPSVTPTDCPNPFIDITGNIFYTAIHYLNCRGVVNGLDPNHYGPAGTSTRGQFAKVVVLGFGTPLFTPTTQDFVDVSPSYFAYLYIESGFHAGILSGFDPATCAAHGLATPCYLPNLPITRAQLTKLVVNAGGYTLITPQGGVPDFVDVLPSNVFYVSIETAYHAGIVSGYPGHLYLPNQNIRRDQMAQIVYEGIIHRP